MTFVLLKNGVSVCEASAGGETEVHQGNPHAADVARDAALKLVGEEKGV